MLKAASGIMDISASRWDGTVSIRFKEEYGDSTYLVELDKRNLRNFIVQLQIKEGELNAWDERYHELVKHTNFVRLYREFEARYNPYPVQMSRNEAFGNARRDGLISDEMYMAAKRYYGNLWCYVGD